MPFEYQFELAQSDQTYEITLETDATHEFSMENPIQIVQGDPYTGTYEVTPTQEEQTLLTNGLLMQADVIINPIPSNYGLITWNGSTLTVS